MNSTVNKFNEIFAAAPGTSTYRKRTFITADEWFAIREEITKLKKQVEQLQWQLREQD